MQAKTTPAPTGIVVTTDLKGGWSHAGTNHAEGIVVTTGLKAGPIIVVD